MTITFECSSLVDSQRLGDIFFNLGDHFRWFDGDKSKYVKVATFWNKVADLGVYRSVIFLESGLHAVRISDWKFGFDGSLLG